jgi:transcription elongation factor Elf1
MRIIRKGPPHWTGAFVCSGCGSNMEISFTDVIFKKKLKNYNWTCFLCGFDNVIAEVGSA